MILVVETPIDLANYLDVALVRLKHPTPNVYHIPWGGFVIDELGEPKSERWGRKLYITGHGDGLSIGDFGPNDLAEKTKNLIVCGKIDKIILLACCSGKETNFKGAIGVSTYCKVFADKLALDTKRQFPVTGYNGDQVTLPGGHSRVSKEDDESVRLWESLKAEAFKGNEKKVEELEKWAAAQKPTCPGDLIKVADEAYKQYTGYMNHPDKLLPQLSSTVKSKAGSKTYVNRT